MSSGKRGLIGDVDMYYPLQVPFILNQISAKHILYKEETPESLCDFIICLWEMQPLTGQSIAATHIILADGCIDLVVDYRHREIGFAGMSKTLFDDKIQVPDRHFGVRMKPGAFRQLSGLPAGKAMDKFLPINAVFKDFDVAMFFTLPIDKAKIAFVTFLEKLVQDKKANEFTTLFDKFSESIPATTSELYETLHYSPRQCQRLFKEHFGLSPQMVLSILRFQRCLTLLTSKNATPSEVLATMNYYDQPHFINDFKKNIGLTPQEYLTAQNLSHIYNADVTASSIISENNLRRENTMSSKIINKSSEMIKKASNAHLGVVDENGYPVVMSMSLTNTESISEVYMTTTLDSNKAVCLKKNNKASLCISNENDNITLVGEIEICTDQETKSKCWQNWFNEVYEGGETDPNYCVLKFTTKRYKLFIGYETAEGCL